MEIWHKRRKTTLKTTFSDLYIQGIDKQICYLLEDVVREQYIDGKWIWKPEYKIYGETAIPSGRYPVGLIDSPKFGPDTIWIMKVPDFEDIRCHAGNDDKDTHGCPITGSEIILDPAGDGGNVGGSKIALEKLKSIVVPVLKNKQPVWWNIKNWEMPNGT